MKHQKLIDYNNLSLDEWLELISIQKQENSEYVIDYQFVTQAHYNEYINTIYRRDIKPILKLFLIGNVYMNSDEGLRSSLLRPEFNGKKELIKESEFLQRLFSLEPPWLSIKWIIDLLPRYPQLAIQSIRAYTIAHIQYLPDGRATGLNDAINIIKAKYMEHSLPVRQTLLNLNPRDFELLVGYLYYKKGYIIKITSKTRDGGYDILAEKNTVREHKRLYIECKLHSSNIGVPIVRNVLGTLSIENATKSVIVASSYFTKPAYEEARKSKRVELIDIELFDKEMRTVIDYNWVFNISDYIKEMNKLYL